MTDAWWFVQTRTTNDIALPPDGLTQGEFNRRVSYALQESTTTVTQAGQVVLYLSPNARAYHLLCDGQVLNSIDFPQLADAIGATGDTFTLPTQAGLWTNSVTPPAVPAQIVAGGAVSSGTTVTTPTGDGQAGGSSGGGVDSGGRYRISGDAPNPLP